VHAAPVSRSIGMQPLRMQCLDDAGERFA
jgi:hypothetical protein